MSCKYSTNDIHFSYGSHCVLNGISFSANSGEIIAFLGPNGAGKTTLFNCIIGLFKPSFGSILIDGVDINLLSRKEIARKIAFVPQNHSPSFPYSVKDFIVMGRAPYLSTFSSPKDIDYNIVYEIAENIGITKHLDKAYTNLSGGEMRLVIIARALAQQADILILDEPNLHLDYKNQAQILEKVKVLARQKNLVIFMSIHDPNMASFFADRIIMLSNKGKIMADGLPDKVLTKENIEKLYQMEVEIMEGRNRMKIVIPLIH